MSNLGNHERFQAFQVAPVLRHLPTAFMAVHYTYWFQYLTFILTILNIRIRNSIPGAPLAAAVTTFSSTSFTT